MAEGALAAQPQPLGLMDILIGITGLVLMGLIYFAGVQRGRREKLAEAEERVKSRRDDRIRSAADQYVADVVKISGIQGALAAGVASFDTPDQVQQFLLEVERRGVASPLAKTYRNEIEDGDLLSFFLACAERRDQLRTDGDIRSIISLLQASP